MPHDDASTRISTRFTAASTAAEVVAEIDLHGTTALVTGGASGIGLPTVRALAAAGAEVAVGVRDPQAAAAVLRDDDVRVLPLDLADRCSIAAFVDAWSGPLELLVANAGVVTSGLERTEDGWERQMAVNHLGHFALVDGLRSALGRGAARSDGARIAVLSSTAHMRADVDLDDLHFEGRAYDPQIAYARSKTANALFAVAATAHLAADGVVANAVNPGGIRTGLQRNFDAGQLASLAAAEAAGAFRWKTAEQGAATTLVAAVHPAFAHTGGHYLDDCVEAYVVPDDATLIEHPHGVKAWALDPESAERLWGLSASLTRG